MEKKEVIGKIQSIRIGYGGYQDCMFGVSFTLGGKGWGVGDWCGFWGLEMKTDEHTKWTEEDRDKSYVEVMRKLDQLCLDADVKNVMELKNVPVEVTFEGQKLYSWRILTEVL